MKIYANRMCHSGDLTGRWGGGIRALFESGQFEKPMAILTDLEMEKFAREVLDDLPDDYAPSDGERSLWAAR